MSRGRIQHRALHDDDVGHRRVGRHVRQPFDERLRPRQIGGIDPALDGESAARADVQRRGGGHLHISVRAGELVSVALVFKLKGLADFARREIEAPDQRAVVVVVFGVGAVVRAVLAAPPALDARAAIPEGHVVIPAGHGGDRARDRAVGQRQIIAAARVAGERGGRIGDDAHQVVGQQHNVGDQYKRVVGCKRRDRHHVGRHVPAAERVIDVGRRAKIAIGYQVEIRQGVVAGQFREAERRLRKLDRHRGEIGVVGERQILIVRDRCSCGVDPRIAPGGKRIAKLVHDDRDVADAGRNIDIDGHGLGVLRAAANGNIVSEAGVKQQGARPKIIGSLVNRHFVHHGVKVVGDRHGGAEGRNGQEIGLGLRAARGRGVQHVGINKDQSCAVGVAAAAIFHQQHALAGGADEREGVVRNARRVDHQTHVHRRHQLRDRDRHLDE